MAIEFKGGRKPVDHSKPKLMLVPHLLGLDNPPSVDYLSEVPEWPMYANDVCGDCTIATVAHALQALTVYGVGSEIRLTEEEVVSKYSKLSGYDPRTGENDTGLVVQDVLDDWRKVGYLGPPDEYTHTALVFAFINPSDLSAVRSAINIFGWVYLGAIISQQSMDQFNSGHVWDLPTGGDNSEILGGHAIPCGKYSENGEFTVVTWGTEQRLTSSWWKANVDECWVVITREWLNKHGLSPTGLDLHGLGEDYAQLTGNSNPFPEPDPSPLPSDDPDKLFADQLCRFFKDHPHPFFYKKMMEAAREWLQIKGFS